MVSALEAELPPEAIARALGIRPRELDALEAGVVPDEKVAARLRQLHELGQKADLTDPASILRVFGWQGPAEASLPSLASLPAFRKFLFAIDAVVAAVVIVRVLLL